MSKSEIEPIQVYLEPENPEQTRLNNSETSIDSLKKLLESVSTGAPIEIVSSNDSTLYPSNSEKYSEKVKDAISIIYQDIEPSHYGEVGKLFKTYSDLPIDRKILAEIMPTRIGKDQKYAKTHDPEAKTKPGTLGLG